MDCTAFTCIKRNTHTSPLFGFYCSRWCCCCRCCCCSRDDVGYSNNPKSTNDDDLYHLTPSPPPTVAAATKLWFYQEKGIKTDLSSSNKCICSQNHRFRMAQLWNFALTWASLSFSNEVFSLCSPLNLKELSRQDRIRCSPLLHVN